MTRSFFRLWPAVAAILLCLGCSTETPQDQQYLNLFEKAWAANGQGSLFNLEVLGVAQGPDDWRIVTIGYSHGMGENYPSGEDQAAMLVSPDGKEAKACVFDLATGMCLGGVRADWNLPAPGN